MTKTKKVIGGTIVGLALVVLVAYAALPWVGTHYKINDSGTGLMEYNAYLVRSDIKEGYLVFVEKKKFLSSGLGRKEYYHYEIYEGPSVMSGFFDVWSDKPQQFTSKSVKLKIIGPKIRIDTGSKGIGLLQGLVWYINANLGPVASKPPQNKTAK